MISHVDVLQILSLAWDHPLVTGGLVLMFTPPFFRVVVFFSPLIFRLLVFFSPLFISTALCAVAVLSVGHQIEDTRARGIAGLNAARVLDGDRLSAARQRNNVRRRRAPGEARWQDLVQGLEPGSDWNKSQSSLMNDIKEEGLMTDFRADEGGIEFIEEDFFDRHIQAFREYERSFSFRTGAIAGVEANAATDVPPFSMEMIPLATTEANDGASGPQIPPIVLYNFRTGGTGTAKHFRGAGAVTGPQLSPSPGAKNRAEFAFGSFDMSVIIDAGLARGQQQQSPPLSMFEKGWAATTTTNATKMQQVSPAAGLTNMNNVADNVYKSLHAPIKPDYSFERKDFEFATTKPSGGAIYTEYQRNFVFQGPVACSKETAAKPSGRHYNASLRVGNAVIYNANFDYSSNTTGLEPGSGSVLRNKSCRDRRSSSMTSLRKKRRHLTQEKSAGLRM